MAPVHFKWCIKITRSYTLCEALHSGKGTHYPSIDINEVYKHDEQHGRKHYCYCDSTLPVSYSLIILRRIMYDQPSDNPVLGLDITDGIIVTCCRGNGLRHISSRHDIYRSVHSDNCIIEIPGYRNLLVPFLRDIIPVLFYICQKSIHSSDIRQVITRIIAICNLDTNDGT